MYVSDKHRFVFVHIQKTGGMSFESLLSQHISDLRIVGGRHEHLSRVPTNLLNSWDDYFKFCFVRNPWDRLVSWYSMIHREYQRAPRWRRILKRKPLRMEIWNLALPYINDFDRFVAECTDEVMDGDHLKSFAYNQFDYIQGADGDCGVDFVGKFENMREDASHVLQRIGIDNVELPHKNRSQHAHYTSYYNSTSRMIIEQRFKADIDHFGYQFGQ